MKFDLLALTRYYIPGFRGGGPIQSVSNLVKTFGNEMRFGVLTSDRDFGDAQSYAEVETGTWITRGNSEVFYSAIGYGQWLRIMRVVLTAEFKVIYVNSFFDRGFSILPILVLKLLGNTKIQILIAPRGEFTKGALSLKRLRKAAYISFVRTSGIYKSVIWHASSEDEKNQIISAIGAGARTEVASPGPSVGIRVAQDLLGPRQLSAEESVSDQAMTSCKLRIIFLSRITRMKNLIYALQVLSELDLDCYFDIYGTLDDPKYAEECRHYAKVLSPKLKVRWQSEVRHHEVTSIMRRYDVLFLPTLGENFGHVIGEALSAGVPVLISDRTPWKGIEENGAGWVIALEDRKRFADVLRKLSEATPEHRDRLRKNAESLYLRFSAENDAVARNREMLSLALNITANRMKPSKII